MSKVNNPNPLRLKKKHGSGAQRDATAADGRRLVQAQSMRGAIVAALLVILVFSIVWVALTALANQVFPWLTVVLGFLLGNAVRLAGRGVTWTYPAVAAVLAIFGALVANIVVAASVTAEGLGTGTLHILQAVTTMTWPVFFDEVMNIADAFYAVVAGGVAAFFSSRRLTRVQYFALRLWQQERNGK